MFLALTRQFNYITTSAFYYTPITTSLGNQLIPWGARVAPRWELSPPTKVVGSGSSPGFEPAIRCPSSLFVIRKEKVHLLYALSARSSESRLLSDWSKKKRSLGVCTDWLSNISDFQSYYIGFVTFASSWQKPQDDRGIRNSKLRF